MSDLDNLIAHITRARIRISSILDKITPKIKEIPIDRISACPSDEIKIYERLSRISSSALDNQEKLAEQLVEKVENGSETGN